MQNVTHHSPFTFQDAIDNDHYAVQDAVPGPCSHPIHTLDASSELDQQKIRRSAVLFRCYHQLRKRKDAVSGEFRFILVKLVFLV